MTSTFLELLDSGQYSTYEPQDLRLDEIETSKLEPYLDNLGGSALPPVLEFAKELSKTYTLIADEFPPYSISDQIERLRQACVFTYATFQSREEAIQIVSSVSDKIADELILGLASASQPVFDLWCEWLLDKISPEQIQLLYDFLSQHGIHTNRKSVHPNDFKAWLLDIGLPPKDIMLAIAFLSKDRNISKNEKGPSKPDDNDIDENKQRNIAKKPFDLLKQIESQSEAVPESIRLNFDFWAPIVQDMWNDGIRIVEVPIGGLLKAESVSPLVRVNGELKTLILPLPYIIEVFDEYIRQKDINAE